MDLLSVTVSGYKRFRTTTSLQTNGKLVAILGPNEAGKSSLLEAITLLTDNRPIDPRDISRGLQQDAVSIAGRFYLDEDDLDAAGLHAPRSMIVTKAASGKRTYRFDPPAPPRDLSHRPRFLASVIESPLRADLETLLVQAAHELSMLLGSILEPLRGEKETLDVEEVDALQALLNQIRALPDEGRTPELDNLMSELAAVIAAERAPLPARRAADALFPRLPAFRFFDEAARNLQSQYSISSLKSEVPVALRNLLEVAELPLEDLFAAVDRGDTPQVTTLEHRASRTLAAKFRAVWNQSGIEARLRIQGDIFEIQILDTNDAFTSIAERSDGLRQFLALQAFSTCNHVDHPILLIDEAEQRLHYDAQADLVQMLARQSVAPKVIYTTHSAGCLPEDLGNGVRMVVPSERETSRIVNRFWQQGGEGIAPLLIGMGASTMAFFPTRRAVMVEGAVDMLLYPTLMREVLNSNSLGFQFVPGLSNIRRTMTRDALKDEHGIAYLVDGDGGGDRIAALLQRRGGVADEDIFRARSANGEALEIEDFIDLDQLLSAVNRHIGKHHSEVAPIERTVLPSGRRIESLAAAFLASTGVALPKVDVAYELLDEVHRDPQARLVDDALQPTLLDIARRLCERMQVRS